MVFLYGANFYKNTVPAINPQVIIGGQILASSAVSEKIKRKKEIERMKQEEEQKKQKEERKEIVFLMVPTFSKTLFLLSIGKLLLVDKYWLVLR